MINILILSVGSRNKIVQYFRRELSNKGNIIAADQSPYAPALYEANKAVITPSINQSEYLNAILKICLENRVSAVLSLIDPELSIIAQKKRLFNEINVKVLVPDSELVNMSHDKYQMYRFLKDNGFKTPITYLSKEECLEALKEEQVQYPLFIKPRKGSASQNIGMVNNRYELDYYSDKHPDLIFQEYMNGPEYGVDVYSDMISGDIISIFLKEKLRMRAGETDKSVSVIDEKCNEIIETFINTAGYRGVIDIDIFKVRSEFYISEVNPRFGGGYPHAYEC